MPAASTKSDPEVESQRKAVRRYWDAHPIATDSVSHAVGTAGSFDTIVERWRQGMNPGHLAFFEHCAGKRILEVGCGIAIDGHYLASIGTDYQAVDLSRESLKLARTHFDLRGLPSRFANADATRLPFADDTLGVVFSIGVLHHVPDMDAACREVVRVTRPGGTIRVMLYNRRSYHYALVNFLVRPLLWLLLHVPFGGRMALLGPPKLRNMYEVCRRHGFDRQRILSISTDWSEPGEDDFNPLSYFVTEREMRKLFEGLEEFEFQRFDLKYFPLPRFREAIEKRWGFFLQMTARKPAAVPSVGTPGRR